MPMHTVQVTPDSAMPRPAAVRALSCCSAVGNISSEPLQKYSSENKNSTMSTTIQISMMIRTTVFMDDLLVK